MPTDPFRVATRLAGVGSSPVRDILNVVGRGDIISFAGGIPDASLFELDDLTAAFTHVLTHQGRRALQYASTRGELELREQAANRLSRTIPTSPDQIQITSGSQEGIYLAATALIDPGDLVLVEEPTYLAALQAFGLAGADLQAVPSDSEGMIPEALAEQLRQRRPAFVYLIPTFQNPTGRSMSLTRRRAIAEVLVAAEATLVEDDPYGELRFEGEAAPPLASLPGMAERTLLLNSASKVMAPGVRVGWVRAAGSILRTLEIAKQAIGLQSPVTDQLAIAHYLATCDLDDHIARVAKVYRERRDAMAASLRHVLPGGATMTAPQGGMFLWVRLGGEVDTALVLPRAVEHGVAFVPGWPFFAGDPDRTTMRLSFVTNSPETIATGVSRLAASFGW